MGKEGIECRTEATADQRLIVGLGEVRVLLMVVFLFAVDDDLDGLKMVI